MVTSNHVFNTESVYNLRCITYIDVKNKVLSQSYSPILLYCFFLARAEVQIHFEVSTNKGFLTGFDFLPVDLFLILVAFQKFCK